jgi:hypothetical protein
MSLTWRRAVSGCVVLLVMGLAGCASRPTVKQQREQAFEEGRQKALQEQTKDQAPVVLFRGDVRNTRVPWREGLTLAEALVTAQYTWTWDPRLVTVTRQGETHSINPKRLMRGQDNPELEPGDLVEVRH